MNQEIVPVEFAEKNPVVEFHKICEYIRVDIRDNPYITETMRVLPVGGYRSAIGSFWNAVVDDLRNKIIFRSLSLFNKEIKMAVSGSFYNSAQEIELFQRIKAFELYLVPGLLAN